MIDFLNRTEESNYEIVLYLFKLLWTNDVNQKNLGFDENYFSCQ